MDERRAMTIRLPAHLWRALRIASTDHRMPMTRIIMLAVAQYLGEPIEEP